MFDYIEKKRYFAQAAAGFEAIVEKELSDLGAERLQPGFRGVHFCADPAALYRINYQSRLVSRVLAPLKSFACRSRDDLYREALSVDWAALMSVDHTFGIFANVSGNSNLRHSNFAALCLKDAIADCFTNSSGRRPNVDRVTPDIWLNLHIEKSRGTISLDTSGGSLHRRGYRGQSVQAPMQETVAAAMVALSGWDGSRPVYDPMCGSGTLLCEAMMVYCRIPAGYFRKSFGFRCLPDFDPKLWEKVREEAALNIRELPRRWVSGSDIDRLAVKAAHANCRRLPGGGTVNIARQDFRNLGNLENRVILCNPPYGIRMQQEDDLGQFYKDFGDFLKQRCKGSQAYVYFGERELLKKIGLKPAWKKPLRNAGLDGRVAKYELY